MDNPLKRDWDEDDNNDYGEELMDEFCPCCGREYDEIDYEYQACHICKHINDNQNKHS